MQKRLYSLNGIILSSQAQKVLKLFGMTIPTPKIGTSSPCPRGIDDYGNDLSIKVDGRQTTALPVHPDSWIDCSVDQLAELYSSEPMSLLDSQDSLIPTRTVTIQRRPSDPWFDQECRQTKRVVRRLERSACLRCTPEATAAWYSQRREYRALSTAKTRTILV